MLAAAADEAERIRAEAKAARSHAAGQATRTIARAETALADAEAEAGRLVAEGAAQVENATAEARRIIDQAEESGREIRAEAAAAVLARAWVAEQRAAELAHLIHRQAAEVGSAARLQARDEIVRMLDTAREQRRRSDFEAAAIRERPDLDAATRRSALLADVAALEHRCAALNAEAALVVRRPVAAAPSTGWTDSAHPRRLHDRLRWRSRSLRAR
jgi:hypothetical protein